MKAKAETRVPLSRPYIDEREEEHVLDVLRSGRLSLGPAIERFEQMFAERVRAPYAAAVSSGTAALHLLCHAAGVQDGDEVITSPISFVSTANCFIFEGGSPVFVDVDPETLSLDPSAVEAAITERTKGIMAVDMFGYPCELDELRAIAERHGLWLLDDSCEALGTLYKGQPIGSHGISGAFGFYPNKQMTTGEGGFATTHSEEEFELLKSLRNQGRSYENRWFHHVRLGFNYRLSDLQAAVGIAQLEKLDEILPLRDEAASRYGELLAGVDGVDAPYPDDKDHERSWFVYVPRLARGIDRDRVLELLAEEDIEAGNYVPCVHLMPYMRERFGFAEGMCPVAEDAASRTLALPFYTGIDPEDQERVVVALARAIDQA